MKKIGLLAFVLIFASAASAAPELNPGFDSEKEKSPTESALRRGEIIFFISYPFTFLASFAVYYGAAAGVTALDSGGQKNFSPDGGFFALAAVTASFLSFGIAMDDYYAIKTATRAEGKAVTSYLSFSYRF